MRNDPWSLSRIAVISGLLLAAGCEGPSPRTVASSGTSVVARVGDRAITLEEVDQKAIASNRSVYQELYDARRSAVETLIAEELLTQEAKKRGVSKDELIEQEITPNIDTVTDSDVEAFYNQNRNRMGGRSIEQIGEQIKAYLQTQSERQARESFVDKLKENAGIEIALEPPRVPVTVADNERVKGGRAAKVTIVEYSDFQ